MKSVETCNSDKFRFFLFLLDDNNFHCALLCCMIMLTQRKPLTSFDGLSPPLITATYYPPSNLANKRYYLEINSHYDRKICILYMFQNSSIFLTFLAWTSQTWREPTPCMFISQTWMTWAWTSGDFPIPNDYFFVHFLLLRRVVPVFWCGSLTSKLLWLILNNKLISLLHRPTHSIGVILVRLVKN